MRHPQVETSQGRLRGRFRGGTIVFRGIPFAAPPVGPLRWRAPQSAPTWSGVRDARRAGAQPMQAPPGVVLTGRAAPVPRPPTSEDCLYLNLWTPSLSPDRPLPVLFWLYGGGFLIGSGSTFLYDGRKLARRGAVVVTANYRLGALGLLDLTSFLSPDLAADPELGVPTNLALRDQLAALEWVRENISAFGGDPTRVTAFGESAGAMSLGMLLGAPRARGLFSRAILQSGACENLADRTETAQRSRIFLEKLGFDAGRLDAEALRRLREIPAETVLKAQMRSLGGRSPDRSRLPWLPRIDEEIVPRAPLDAIREGAARDVELIVGHTREEWKLFTALDRSQTCRDADELLRRTQVMLAQHRAPSRRAEEMIALYRERREDASDHELWTALRTDEVFRLPAVRLAEAQNAAGGAVRFYRFDFPLPAFSRAAGACHAVDLPFTFGTVNHPLFWGLFLGDRAAKRLSEMLQETWVAFASRDEETPLLCCGLEWPIYDSRRRSVLRLDREIEILDAPDEEERIFWESLPEESLSATNAESVRTASRRAESV